MSAEPLLRARAITRRVRDGDREVAILDDVSLEVAVGERVALLEKTVSQWPRYVLAYMNLGRAQIRIGEVEVGLNNCRKAVRMQGNWGQLHYWLGRTLREVKRNNEAARHFIRAAQLDPHNATYRREAARYRSNRTR